MLMSNILEITCMTSTNKSNKNKSNNLKESRMLASGNEKTNKKIVVWRGLD